MASASPAPAPTPLEQRQWRREAQRALRLALTAVKAARTRYEDCSAAGMQAATALSNALLTQQYLPGMPLGALRDLPGLQAAAAAKLGARQQAALQQLRGALRDLQAAVADMAAAVDELGGGGSEPGQGFRRAQPLFHSISLPTALGMLQELLAMFSQDCALKGQLVEAMGAASSGAGALGGGTGTGAAAAGGGEDEAKGRVTVYLSAWLSRPGVDEGRVEHLLLVLTDDMAGF
jgi:hypothetical protein